MAATIKPHLLLTNETSFACPKQSISSMKRAESNNFTAACAVRSGLKALIVERPSSGIKFDAVGRRESIGKFGIYGGKFVPETLMSSLGKLEADFNFVLHDAKFQVCFLFFWSENFRFLRRQCFCMTKKH